LKEEINREKRGQNVRVENMLDEYACNIPPTVLKYIDDQTNAKKVFNRDE